eukprot:jgi/Chlat1/408/Chrsp10S01513
MALRRAAAELSSRALLRPASVSVRSLASSSSSGRVPATAPVGNMQVLHDAEKAKEDLWVRQKEEEIMRKARAKILEELKSQGVEVPHSAEHAGEGTTGTGASSALPEVAQSTATKLWVVGAAAFVAGYLFGK